MKNALIDTGFWFALYDVKDQHYQRASEISEYIDNQLLLIPWPSLYETLNTKFIKRQERVIAFEKNLKKPNIKVVDDEPYREVALNDTFEFGKVSNRIIGLTDNVIRAMLSDYSLKIDYLITFNQKDFNDICRKRLIEIIE